MLLVELARKKKIKFLVASVFVLSAQNVHAVFYDYGQNYINNASYNNLEYFGVFGSSEGNGFFNYPSGIFNNSTANSVLEVGLAHNEGIIDNSGIVRNNDITHSPNYQNFNWVASYQNDSHEASQHYHAGNLLINKGIINNNDKSFFENKGNIENYNNIHNLSGSRFENSRNLFQATYAYRVDIYNYLGGRIFNEGELDNGTAIDFKSGINKAAIINLGELDNNGSVSGAAVINNYGTIHNLSGLYTTNINFISQQHQGQGAITNKNGGIINNYQYLKNDANTILSNSDSAALNNSGIIDNAGTITNLQSGTIQNSQDATIINTGKIQNNGTFQSDGLVTNRGQIENAGDFFVEAMGSVDSLNGAYTQSSGKTRITGEFLGDLHIDGGEIGGSGTVNGAGIVDGSGKLSPAVYIGQNGILNPGDPQTFTINGDLDVDAGTMRIQIDETGSDFVQVSGHTMFNNARIEINFINGYLPSIGEALSFFNSDNGVEGLETVSLFTNLAGVTLSQEFGTNPNQWTVFVTDVAEVPVPGAVWLFASGLLLLRANSRRYLRGATICELN